MKKWIKKTAIKVIKTMAQTALGIIGTGVLLTDINWVAVASATALSGIACVLMNIAKIEEE